MSKLIGQIHRGVAANAPTLAQVSISLSGVEVWSGVSSTTLLPLTTVFTPPEARRFAELLAKAADEADRARQHAEDAKKKATPPLPVVAPAPTLAPGYAVKCLRYAGLSTKTGKEVVFYAANNDDARNFSQKEALTGVRQSGLVVQRPDGRDELLVPSGEQATACEDYRITS